MKSSLHPGIEAMLANAKKNSAGKVCLATEAEQRVWGFPSDHLSYRWLSDQNFYPCGRVLGLAGVKESCKSAYAMTLARLWMDNGGVCIYVDTENKKSPALYRAVVGEHNLERTLDYVAFTTEEWQGQVLEAIEFAEKAESMAGVPILFIVDSLGGVNAAEATEKIRKEGLVNARNTTGMVKAKSHNEFFKYISEKLYMKPHSFLYVNHLSDDPMSPIQGAKRKPGGTGQDYHAVLDLWFSVVRGTPDHKVRLGYTQRILKIQCAKNSIGASQRRIEIPYRWSNDAETGQIDRCWFDWDAATARLLSDDGTHGLKKRIKEDCLITVSANKYSCRALGVTGVTDSEMGATIRTNVDLREHLSDRLGVNRSCIWDGLGLDAAAKAVYELSSKERIVNKDEISPEPEST
tara:strand:+ start:614 stop:1831 length:1218 start_codon:yes stop_codon:yes gene_type:complete